jgi:hypothetical protein
MDTKSFLNMKANIGNVVEHAGTGFNMPEAVARKIDNLSKSSSLPKDFGYRRIAKAASEFQLEAGSRTDVSTITTDSVDRDIEVVLPGGGDWSKYNKIVTFAHRYDELPVGSNLWIKPKANGLIGKTHYPEKPADWGDAPWLPSAILHLMQQPVPTCTGKSIGFLPLNVRAATQQEKTAHPEWDGVPIIDKWSGIEYAVAPVPANPDAEMDAVSKGIKDGSFDPKTGELIAKEYQRYSSKGTMDFIPALRIIAEHGPVTTEAIGKLLGLNGVKIVNVIRFLMQHRYVDEADGAYKATDAGWGALAAAGDPQSSIVMGSKAVTRITGLLDAKQVSKGFTQPGDTPVPLARTYTQYIDNGDTFEPIGNVKLAGELDQFAYRIVSTWTGIAFAKMQCQTDELYYFENSAMNDALTEIDKFWDLKPDYDKLKLMHNRGIMMYGPPGMGKTACAHQIAKMIVDRGDVVFYANSISTLIDGLTAFRDVEPDRKVVVVLEDADEYVGYEERNFLQLLDGEKSISGILYLATTNYIENFPPRVLRPGRFDKKIFVGPPPIAGRKAYLSKKLAGIENDAEIDRLAKATDGMSFGDLRELITAVYALKEPVESVLARLKGRMSGRKAALDLAIKWKSTMTENDNSGGGNLVPDNMPECPKCKCSDAVKLEPPPPGTESPCDQYKCWKCGTQFEKMKDDDGGDDMGLSAKPPESKNSSGDVPDNQVDSPVQVPMLCPGCQEPMTKGEMMDVSGLGDCDTFKCEKCDTTVYVPRVAKQADKTVKTEGTKKLNTACESRAMSAAKSGKFNEGEWDAPNGGDRKEEDCLGIREGADVEPSAKYTDPIFKDGELYRRAVANVESRESGSSIGEAAKRIMAAIMEHDKKSMEPFYSPKTIERAKAQAKEEKINQYVARLDKALVDAVDKRRGRV